MSADLDRGTDFDRLVRIAEKVSAQYLDIGQEEWATSPLNWIRQVPSSHKKGKIGENLVMEWARDTGLEVGPRRHRGHDCIIAGSKIEVKFSLRWNSGEFAFLGIRDFDYDVAALLGIAPSEVYLWFVPKPILWRYARSQERGASGRGSKWLPFPVSEPPKWLRRWGGSFAEAQIALKEARRHGQQHRQSAISEEIIDDPVLDIGF